MKISELFLEAIMEDQEYEFKSVLNQDNPIKWAKTIVAYATGNEEIVSEHGFAKSGFLMFRDGYDAEDTMICCSLLRCCEFDGAWRNGFYRIKPQ